MEEKEKKKWKYNGLLCCTVDFPATVEVCKFNLFMKMLKTILLLRIIIKIQNSDLSGNSCLNVLSLRHAPFFPEMRIVFQSVYPAHMEEDNGKFYTVPHSALGLDNKKLNQWVR